MEKWDSAMTTTPLTPKGLNSWKEVSTIVALQALAAETRISLTTSTFFSNSGLQPCSSTNRCFPSACNDLPPFTRVVSRCPTSVARQCSNALYRVLTKLQEKNGSSGNRVGAWTDVGGSQGSPLLCKEGRGEVERGAASGCFYPSSPPLTKGRRLLGALLTKGRNLKRAHTKA